MVGLERASISGTRGCGTKHLRAMEDDGSCLVSVSRDTIGTVSTQAGIDDIYSLMIGSRIKCGSK